jgi:hypothetical protein
MYERNDDFMSFRHWIVGKGKHLHMAYGLISALIQHPTGEDGKWLAAMKVKESLPHADSGPCSSLFHEAFFGNIIGLTGRFLQPNLTMTLDDLVISTSIEHLS